MLDEHLSLLVRSLENHRHEVEITVDAAMYACCGRAWQPREGYEQVYRGYIANLDMPSPGEAGGGRLIACGAGTISYFVIFGLDHVADVRAL